MELHNHEINQKKRKKGWTCERQNGKVLLPLHWFFISDSTTIKTYLVTYDGKPISNT